MNTIRILTCIFCLIIVSFVTAGEVKRTSDGIQIMLSENKFPDVKFIRIQVISDNIFHVSATPESKFPKFQSLIITNDFNKQTEWKIAETEDTIILTTKTTKAKISRKTGGVVFTDLKNNVILQEQKNSGKSFSPVEIEGTHGYSFRQIFESPKDEAFYGLGQHQSDEFNRKGKNEELFQYNTKVSVPFILSNKNYGILWDNYSLSRFGNPQPYLNLDEIFTLSDKYGIQGGLTATYQVGKGSQLVSLVRKEQNIDYENVKTISKFPESFPFNKATVFWEGEIQPRESGLHHFKLYYAGYVRVFLNDSLVVKQRWRTAWNPNSFKFAQYLKQNQKYKVKIEWIPDGSVSYIGLKGLSPVPEQEQAKLSFWSEMGQQLDYYFIHGNNTDEVISGYRTLTGKAPMMPKQAMGFWQSRERYKTQDELLSTLKEFRSRQIPVDNIVLDWNYWKEDAWGSHEFDIRRFPDPKGMIDSVHQLNAGFMISVWPKFYTSTTHFKEFDQRGWMYKQALKDSILDWVGPGYPGSFYDAYNGEARKLFWKQLKEHLYGLGVDAWWMDASEPNIKDCTDMNYRKALCGPTALGSSTEYFNAYALMNARAIYEGLMSSNPDKRVFQLTRSGFAGLQRYAAATWSGDIASRWEDLKAQIPAGINYSMSGIPYWTMDNGGFCVEKRFVKAGEGSADLEEWRELNVRWHQFGAFVPVFRTHGQYPYREIWNIAPETHPAYNAMLFYNRLRYRLMPYIYTLSGKTWSEDYTIMRGLVMDYGKDKNVLNIGDQYMFGPSLMVCPVYEFNARTRKVYFPEGNGWYNFYNGKYFQGGQNVEVDAPYERMPVFVPAGSIIPVGNVIQYTGQKQDDIIIYVYAGKDGKFSLYEDEGTNNEYLKGNYSTITFEYSDSNKILKINQITGGYKEMQSNRTLKVVLVKPDKPTGVDQYPGKFIRVAYIGQTKVVKLR